MKKCTSTPAQNYRLIAALKKSKQNSIELRRTHGVFSVSSRVSDLRKRGAVIITERITLEGHKNIALYGLQSLPADQE